GDEIPESRQPAAADQEKREPDWPQNNCLREPRLSQKEETQPDSCGARSEQQGQLSLDGFLSPEKPRQNVADDERRSKNSRSRQESRKIPRTHDEDETQKTEGDYSRPRCSPDDSGEHEESETAQHRDRGDRRRPQGGAKGVAVKGGDRRRAKENQRGHQDDCRRDNGFTPIGRVGIEHRRLAASV